MLEESGAELEGLRVAPLLGSAGEDLVGEAGEEGELFFVVFFCFRWKAFLRLTNENKMRNVSYRLVFTRFFFLRHTLCAAALAFSGST